MVGTTLTLLEGGGGAGDAAFAINDSGTIVGTVKNTSGKWRATRWNVGTTLKEDLSTLAGSAAGNSSYAYGVNVTGRIVGKSDIFGSSSVHAFRTAGGSDAIDESDDLGTMNSGSGNSEATAINDFDEVVGASHNAAGQYRAFYKFPVSGMNEGFVDLGVLGTGSTSKALDISNKGVIVGESQTVPGGTWRAWVSFNGGAMVNLNTVLANGTGWTLYSAQEVNDNGWIVGVGNKSGSRSAYLLTPNY